MPVTIRSARASGRDEVPAHWEACPLRTPWRLLGWLGGAAGVILGTGGMVVGEGTPLEAAGAAVAALGIVALVGAVRCRRWTISIGAEWILSENGPFRRAIPRRSVEGVAVRPATGLRRLYARREAVLALPASGHRFVLPSQEPEVLVAVLGDRAGSSLGEGGA